jgi:hypothetical protein
MWSCEYQASIYAPFGEHDAELAVGVLCPVYTVCQIGNPCILHRFCCVLT